MSTDTLTLPSTADPLPLRKDQDDVIRIGDTRVTLDTVVFSYEEGASAEEIASQYPSVGLADVHAVIAFYLRRRVDVDSYLRARNDLAKQTRQENESRFDSTGIRERLLARRVKKGF